MDLGLSGKSALVAGSSQGIGLAVAESLAAEGVRVTLFARNEDRLRIVRDNIETKHPNKHGYLVADFSMPDQVIRALGKNAYDIIINNTGGPKPGPVSLASTDEFQKAFEQHVIVNQIMVQRSLDHMKRNNFGRIVNIISTSVKQPLENLGVSNTIRGAVANWSKTLANELGPFGVTVNNILPGATETARLEAIISKKVEKSGQPRNKIIEADYLTIPTRRYGRAEEVAAAVSFLCSERAAYINGVNLPVDGGRTKSL